MDRARLRTEGVVHLATKNIFGSPGLTSVIKFDGVPAANLQLRFRGSANNVAFSSPVDASGTIQLPPKAGVYGVELRDNVSGLISYGQATIALPVSGFTSIQQTTLPTFSPFGSVWPQVSMLAGDITGDGHPDLVIASGFNAADGSLTNPGIYAYEWNASTSTLTAMAPIALANRTICGAAILDVDGDGQNDIVFVDNVLSTYAFDVCTLSNKGSAGFSAASCVTETGTASSMFRCAGGIALADFDRDGRVDIAVAGETINPVPSNATKTKDVRVYQNTTSGFSEHIAMTLPSTASYESIAIGDLNDDGELDIVTNGGAPPAVHMFTGEGNFSFGEPTQMAGDQTDPSGGFVTDQVTLGYLNSDTSLDILLSHTNGPSSVLFSGTAGYTLTPVPDFSEQHCSRFQVLDLDVNGTPDIIIPYKNRLLANNTFGALWANASNIGTAASPSTSNSIFGSATTSSWVEGSMIFADLGWRRKNGRSEFRDLHHGARSAQRALSCA